ncbi:MAG: AraC family transcriptional regulator [Lentimicrobium sp.]|nr:AraC family transcriptional regulator [Lentimicrobium sp.]
MESQLETCRLHLKNMVSSCCLKLIRNILEHAGATPTYIKMGEVEFRYNPLEHTEAYFVELLATEGFQSIMSREEVLVEKIKMVTIELVHKAGNVNSIIRNSDYLVERMGMSYAYLSSIFSKYEHITLEKFIIMHKIEKVKELLEYGEYTLSEIAIQLGYSSVQYLSNQFRQITGVSVSEYKKGGSSRTPIETIGTGTTIQ